MNSILAMPVVFPLFTGIIMLFFWKHRQIQRIINFLGSTATLALAIYLTWYIKTSGIQCLYIGAWKAPFGIIFTADLLTMTMILVSGIIGFATSIYSLGTMDETREHFGYYPLLQIMIMGINGSFMTGDLFNMFVWFEVLLISSFSLVALGGERSQLEGAIKYVILNLFSSSLFVVGVG
ncbi:MAG TPA: Na+/H+ antiporter subunit D, partial [Candidatus Kapabacteria bacterium]|nr:Na+/H+ antiporter subunit D [Candidatus Kapabacteria bacterium]